MEQRAPRWLKMQVGTHLRRRCLLLEHIVGRTLGCCGQLPQHVKGAVYTLKCLHLAGWGCTVFIDSFRYRKNERMYLSVCGVLQLPENRSSVGYTRGRAGALTGRSAHWLHVTPTGRTGSEASTHFAPLPNFAGPHDLSSAPIGLAAELQLHGPRTHRRHSTFASGTDLTTFADSPTPN